MIDFDLTDEQRLLEQSVREWAAREVAPRIHDLDREHRFDTRFFAGMASLGLLGVSVPEEYGGAGMDYLSLGLASELRRAGRRAEIALTGDRLGNQLKYASRRGIPFAAIVGPDELATGQVVLKELASGEQVKVPRAEVAAELARRLGPTPD